MVLKKREKNRLPLPNRREEEDHLNHPPSRQSLNHPLDHHSRRLPNRRQEARHQLNCRQSRRQNHPPAHPLNRRKNLPPDPLQLLPRLRPKRGQNRKRQLFRLKKQHLLLHLKQQQCLPLQSPLPPGRSRLIRPDLR